MAYERILNRLRTLVKLGNFRITEHAYEEAWEDGITLKDIDNAILTGYIIEKQLDSATQEAKYIVRSQFKYKRDIELVAKISITGRMYIITVYLI